MERLLSDLQQHPLSWAFLQPVNAEEVPDYYEVIKDPMGTGSPIRLHILPWVYSRPWFRLQHHGTQTRDEPIPGSGRFRGRCAIGIRQLSNIQPGWVDLCPERNEDGEVHEGPASVVSRETGGMLTEISLPLCLHFSSSSM